jgi:hypothetical protein
MRRFAITQLWILAFALAPVWVSLAAGAVATAYGCPLDEASVHPCVVLGADLGPRLHTLGVLGWFALGTFPIGLLVCALHAGYTLWMRARRKRSATG